MDDRLPRGFIDEPSVSPRPSLRSHWKTCALYQRWRPFRRDDAGKRPDGFAVLGQNPVIWCVDNKP
jgi:hypothetical protein